MEAIYKIDLDLYKAEKFTVLEAHQGDKNSRFILATLTDSNESVDISNCTAAIDATLNNVIVAENVSCQIIDNKAKIPLTTEMLQQSGILKIDLKITEDDTLVTAQTLRIKVGKSVINEDSEIESHSSIGENIKQLQKDVTTKESKSNKVTSFDAQFSDTTNTRYPTVNAIIKYLTNYYYMFDDVDAALNDKANINNVYQKNDCLNRFALGVSAIYDANGKMVNASKQTELSGGSLAGDSSVVTAYIAQTVTHITSGTFAGCTNLQTVYINQSEGSVQITAGAIPSSAEIVYTDAFNGVTANAMAINVMQTLINGKIDKTAGAIGTNELAQQSVTTDKLYPDIADKITLIEKVFDFESLGQTKTTHLTTTSISNKYKGFSTRIKNIPGISKISCYILATENSSITCSLLSDDRDIIFASCTKDIISDTSKGKFVDFYFDDVTIGSGDNIYIQIESDKINLGIGMVSGSATNIVTSLNKDNDQYSNYYNAGTKWSKSSSTTTNTSNTLDFIVYTKKIKNDKMHYLYVSNDYNEQTEDYGITRFATIYDANESIRDNSENNQYTIIVMAGTYTDLQTRYAGISDVDQPGSAYKGIICKDYVFYESEDIYNPQNTVIEWDGAYGFDTLTRADVILKCPYHIKGGTHTHIKGFTFTTKNLRYGIHIETGGNGVNADWAITDCIFNWGGCPDCTDTSNSTYIPVFGHGSACFERGLIANCKINPTNCTLGYQNHENKNYSGKTPAILKGADITIRDCQFGNTTIECRSLYGKISDNFDLLTLDNVIGIQKVDRKYKASEGDKCNWIVTANNCDIADTNMDDISI